MLIEIKLWIKFYTKVFDLADNPNHTNIGEIKKFLILKNGIGIKYQKVSKQVRDWRNMEANNRLKCYQRMKIIPKAFVIPILSLINQCSQNRDSKCYRIYFYSLITLEPFIWFHISLISDLFAYFLTFGPHSIF